MDNMETDNYRCFCRRFREKYLTITETKEKLLELGLEKSLRDIQRCYRCGRLTRLVRQQYRSKNVYRYYLECRHHLGNRTYYNANIGTAYKSWKFINRKGAQEYESL